MNKCIYDQLAMEPGWEELHTILVERYQSMKKRKLKPDHKEWVIWSGQFNGYCRSIHDGNNQETPYTHLFGMWQNMSLMLSSLEGIGLLIKELKRHTSLTKRKAIKKAIDDKKVLIEEIERLYKIQKRRFYNDIKGSQQV